MQIGSVGRLVTTLLTKTLIQDHYRGSKDKLHDAPGLPVDNFIIMPLLHLQKCFCILFYVIFPNWYLKRCFINSSRMELTNGIYKVTLTIIYLSTI